jgi:hypothetical protein
MPIAPNLSRISAALLAASVMLASAPPAASFDFPFIARPEPYREPSREPARTPPRVVPQEITGAISANGEIVDDTARYLAGLQPSANSPLAPLTREEGWAGHARFFDRAFGELDRTQLAKVRAWSSAHLQARRPTMFYTFSGPDFLYADAFFPGATTYVLAALEPVGQIPDLQKMSRGSIGPALGNIASSLHSVLNFSFFITHNMRTQLSAGRLSGTAPILYIFLARAGKTVREASLVALDADGVEHPDGPGVKSAAHGIKIVFSGPDGRPQTLYYFSTNLANDGVGSSGFLKFCEKLGPGDSLIKSASYLLHSGGFTKIRDWLVANSATILEDDSGVPLAYFDRAKWQLQPFGRYITPLGIFPNTYQPKLQELFAKSATPIDFGVGYRWRSHESNLLLAVQKDMNTAGTAPR